MMNDLVQKVKSLLDNARVHGVFPGCAAGIVRGNERAIVTCGTFTYDENSRSVTDTSVYDVASITKSIPVACCALKLIEQGKLAPDDPLIKYVPSFNGSFRDEITITHLLTHTLDLDLRLSLCKDDAADQLLQRILNVQLRSRPGVRFCYANATSILLGLVLEACSGTTLDALANRFFFEQLGMMHTGFDATKFASDTIVPTEIDQWRGGEICGMVHDESAWKLRPRVVGSAGLFSTAADMVLFVSKLLESFTNGAGALFTPDIANVIITNQRPPASREWTGMGWELNQESFMGRNRTSATFGKTGFTGCSIVINPVNNCAVLLLSNHIYPKRRETREQINAVRRGLAELVFGW